MNKTLAAVLMAIYLSLVSMAALADMTRVSNPIGQVERVTP
jgi:hypothetical protein